MRRLFRYISYSIKLTEFVSIAAAIVTFLLPSNIAALNYSYYYALIVQHKVLVCLVLVSIAFGPRIIGLAYRGLQFLLAYVENGATLIASRNVQGLLPFSNLILLAIAFAISAAVLLQFAYVERWALANRSNFVRQAMVTSGAQQEGANQSADAVATYRKILTMFPDDPRNDITEKRIAKINSAIELSKLLSKQGTLAANSQNLKLAYTLHKSAAEIWRENSEADAGIKTIRGNLLETLRKMSAACKAADPAKILDVSVELASFAGQKPQDARNVFNTMSANNLLKTMEQECNTTAATLKLRNAALVERLEQILIFANVFE